jgi:hypothetical protein
MTTAGDFQLSAFGEAVDAAEDEVAEAEGFWRLLPSPLMSVYLRASV